MAYLYNLSLVFYRGVSVALRCVNKQTCGISSRTRALSEPEPDWARFLWALIDRRFLILTSHDLLRSRQLVLVVGLWLEPYTYVTHTRKHSWRQ